MRISIMRSGGNDGRSGDDSHSDDRDGKCHFLELAGHAEAEAGRALVGRVALSKRSADGAGAGRGTVASQHRDGDHGAREEDIEHNAQEGEEGDTTQAADENDSKQSIGGGGARQTLHGLQPSVDLDIVAGQDGEVVGEDAENDGAIEKLQHANSETAETQNHTSDSHGG